MRLLILVSCALITAGTPVPTYAQATQQAATGLSSTDSQLAKDIARDLAELNSLISAIPAVQTSTAGALEKSLTPTKNAVAHAKPDATSNLVYVAKAGVPLRVIENKDSWFLAQNQQNEVGWVQMGSFVASGDYEQVLNAMLLRIQQLKQKYNASPIRISGFSLDLKMPPGVSVQFEFR